MSSITYLFFARYPTATPPAQPNEGAAVCRSARIREMIAALNPVICQ